MSPFFSSTCRSSLAVYVQNFELSSVPRRKLKTPNPNIAKHMMTINGLRNRFSISKRIKL